MRQRYRTNANAAAATTTPKTMPTRRFNPLGSRNGKGPGCAAGLVLPFVNTLSYFGKTAPYGRGSERGDLLRDLISGPEKAGRRPALPAIGTRRGLLPFHPAPPEARLSHAYGGSRSQAGGLRH